MLVREPFSGITPAVYAELSDYQIAEIYLAPRDDNLNLIPLAQRRRPEGTGHPDRAAQELPAPEDLGIPPEVLVSGPPVAFISMFYAVWRAREETPAEITARWWRYLAAEHEGSADGRSPGRPDLKSQAR